MTTGKRLQTAVAGMALLSTMTTATARAADDPPKPVPTRVLVEQVAYKGWTNAYRLNNGTTEVIVVSQIARIVFYGATGGANLLWENAGEAGKPGDTTGGWRNFGGDKAWIWPQDDWPKWLQRSANWPPPPEVDQMPQETRIVGASTLRLTSPVVTAIGARIVRDITLAENGSRLYVVTKVVRVVDGFDTVPVAAWSITQTPFVSGPLIAHLVPTSLAEGWRPLSGQEAKAIHRSPDGATLTIERDPNARTGCKLGIDGDAIGGAIGNQVLTIRADAPGSSAWDWHAGERAQTYISDPGSPYIEWEFTSPLRPLKKGESVSLATTFEIRPLAADRRADQAVEAALRGNP